MNHIDYIVNESVLPWNLFTIQKEVVIEEVYGKNNKFKLLRLTTTMRADDYPKTIFVMGKKYRIQFILLHRCMLDGIPTVIYVPNINRNDEAIAQATNNWRIVLQ
jgi:hypothetical protein